MVRICGGSHEGIYWAYSETASAKQAHAELTKLEMRNGEIHEHIAPFGYLPAKAGWE